VGVKAEAVINKSRGTAGQRGRSRDLVCGNEASRRLAGGKVGSALQRSACGTGGDDAGSTLDESPGLTEEVRVGWRTHTHTAHATPVSSQLNGTIPGAGRAC
jgi:hypothetical protein